jgi:hypothetical protein
VHRLHVPQRLRATLASTNVIESAFAIVERVCLNVKRWRQGDQCERRGGASLISKKSNSAASGRYKHLPILLRVLETLKPSKKTVANQKKASSSGLSQPRDFQLNQSQNAGSGTRAPGQNQAVNSPTIRVTADGVLRRAPDTGQCSSNA